MINLRPYQTDMIGKARAAFLAGAMAVLLVAPTGAGKTVMLSEMVRASQSKGNRVLVLVHRTELLDQVSSTLTAFNVGHSLIAAGHKMTYAAVQVASVQTLARRLEIAPEFDFIIIDEAHHIAGKNQWAKVLARYPNARYLGVTATPCRVDGRGLGNHFQTLVMGPQIRELIEAGYLAQVRMFRPEAQIDTKGLRTKAGDYNREDLKKRASMITGDVVDHYKKLADGKLALAFCVSRLHCAETVLAFQARGISSEVLDGSLSTQDRADRIARFRNRETMVLATCDLVSEGFDLPAIECVIMLRPTQSKGLYMQQIGRGLRIYPGKEHAIILDHAGNCYRHGRPWLEDQAWTLDMDKQRKASPRPLTHCGECFAMCSVGTKYCPVCQSLLKDESKIEGRKVRVQDGDLVPDGDLLDAPYKEVLKWARTPEQLQRVAELRGYKPNWVNNQIKIRETYRDKFQRR